MLQCLPHTMKRKSNVEHKVISKRDEETIENMINEQRKVRDMLNRNLSYRNDFLRAQRIRHFQYEKSRLIGLENGVIGNLRFAPSVKIDDFPDAPNRLAQLERKMNEDLIGRGGPDFYVSRYF